MKHINSCTFVFLLKYTATIISQCTVLFKIKLYPTYEPFFLAQGISKLFWIDNYDINIFMNTIGEKKVFQCNKMVE